MVKLCIVLNFETILNYFTSSLQISCKKIESNSKASQVLFSLIHLLFRFYPICFIIYSCSTVTIQEHTYTWMLCCAKSRQSWPTRLPRPWGSPGKNTGVACHFLLQCMKVKSESEVAQSCPTLATTWTAAYQAPPSMGFSRQQYWSGVPLYTQIWVCVCICIYYIYIYADRDTHIFSYGSVMYIIAFYP